MGDALQSRDITITATLAIVVVKVLVSLTLVFVLQVVFQAHQKIAHGVGVVIGAVLWYYVPPRSS